MSQSIIRHCYLFYIFCRYLTQLRSHPNLVQALVPMYYQKSNMFGVADAPSVLPIVESCTYMECNSISKREVKPCKKVPEKSAKLLGRQKRTTLD